MPLKPLGDAHQEAARPHPLTAIGLSRQLASGEHAPLPANYGELCWTTVDFRVQKLVALLLPALALQRLGAASEDRAQVNRRKPTRPAKRSPLSSPSSLRTNCAIRARVSQSLREPTSRCSRASLVTRRQRSRWTATGTCSPTTSLGSRTPSTPPQKLLRTGCGLGAHSRQSAPTKTTHD